MATEKEIETLLEALHQAPPAAYFQKIDKSSMGIRAIIKLLNESGRKTTAGQISRHMGVSTARVTVLLKKMEARGMLEKQSDPDDGRVVLVQLSPKGKETAEALRRNLYLQVGNVIDQVGMTRMMEFAAISREIRDAVQSRQMQPDDVFPEAAGKTE